MTKNRKKIAAGNFFFFFLSKTSVYLSPGLHKENPEEAFRSQKRTSSTSKHKISFLRLWVIFAVLDPEPDPLT
jgi:hypothetical protein